MTGTEGNGAGKDEVRGALLEYIDSGETIDEDAVERFIAEKLKSKGIDIEFAG